MKTENLIILKADEGKVLTNGVAYGKTVILGNGDKVENYHEITDEEYWELQTESERCQNDKVENRW